MKLRTAGSARSDGYERPPHTRRICPRSTASARAGAVRRVPSRPPYLRGRARSAPNAMAERSEITCHRGWRSPARRSTPRYRLFRSSQTTRAPGSRIPDTVVPRTASPASERSRLCEAPCLHRCLGYLRPGTRREVHAGGPAKLSSRTGQAQERHPGRPTSWALTQTTPRKRHELAVGGCVRPV